MQVNRRELKTDYKWIVNLKMKSTLENAGNRLLIRLNNNQEASKGSIFTVQIQT